MPIVKALAARCGYTGIAGGGPPARNAAPQARAYKVRNVHSLLTRAAPNRVETCTLNI